MRTIPGIINRVSVAFFILLLIPAERLSAQKISFGVFADPIVSWFSSDNKAVTKNDGARAGFNFGFTFNKYFADNYAISTGISLLNAGGRLTNSGNDTLVLHFNNLVGKISPNNKIVYKVQYLSIPLGLKFKSNQIGYINLFADLGIDPKIVIGGKADIPTVLKGEVALKELRRFNLGYHIMGGIEYSLGGTTSMVLGIGFENNFLDLTKDYNKPDGKITEDKITQKMLKLRIGVTF